MGIDFSPIQPRWTPPNVNFYVDDIEEEWLNGDDYDLVHIRYVCSFIRDSAAVIHKSFEHMRPGGWIEVQELDMIVHCDDDSMPTPETKGCAYPILNYVDLAARAWGLSGADLQIGDKIGPMLEEAGFVNVQRRKLKVPVSPWAKDE